MEKQVISCSQYLYLVYTQSGTLYEKILNLPHPTSDPMVTSPTGSNVIDGIIGSISHTLFTISLGRSPYKGVKHEIISYLVK